MSLNDLQSGKKICWRAGEKTKRELIFMLIFTLHQIINRKAILGDHLKYFPGIMSCL